MFHSRRFHRLCSFAIGMLPLVALLSGVQQTHAAPKLSAVRATLVKPLDAHSRAGDFFYVGTLSAWQAGNCQIRANTMVQGQIAEWQRRKDGSNREELRVRFAPVLCDASEDLHVTPVLVAVRGPLKHLDDAGLAEQERADAMRSAMANRPIAGAGGSEGRAEQSAEGVNLAGTGQGEMPDTSAFETGEVRNLRGVRMVLPVNGSDASTMLFSSHSIELPPDTQFFLTFFASSSSPKTGILLKRH
jgi:hypothetical protein